MGSRFRKSFKVAPGVRVNLGKKSTGISIGGKYGGISVNSKTGARARVSAPGTGWSYYTRISGKSKKRRAAPGPGPAPTGRKSSAGDRWLLLLLGVFLMVMAVLSAAAELHTLLVVFLFGCSLVTLVFTLRAFFQHFDRLEQMEEETQEEVPSPAAPPAQQTAAPSTVSRAEPNTAPKPAAHAPMAVPANLPHAYVALDFETTGLSPERDCILEIGAVKYIDGQEAGVMSTFVDPQRPIPPEITRLTGITDGDVAGAPILRDAVMELYRFLDGLPIVAHNASFDVSFLCHAYEELQLPAKVQSIDTLSLARKAFPDAPNHKLGTLVEYLSLPASPSHRALEDARAADQIFRRCLEHTAPKLRTTAPAPSRTSAAAPSKGTLDSTVLYTYAGKAVPLNEDELRFQAELAAQLAPLGCTASTEVNVLSDGVLNYCVNGCQIGRVKLRGRKKKIQLLTDSTCDWEDIQTVEDAIAHLPKWVRYAKHLLQ